MKSLMSLTVRGKQHEWSFTFTGDPCDLEEWRQDGLDVVEIVHVIPDWVVSLGLAWVWVLFQGFKSR